MKRKELIEICDDGIRNEKEAADSLEAGSTERLNAVRTLKEYQSIRKEEKESVVDNRRIEQTVTSLDDL